MLDVNNLGIEIHDLYHKMNVWKLDIWACGVVLLELLCGYPMFLKMKTKVIDIWNQGRMKEGIFSNIEAEYNHLNVIQY